MPRLNAVAVAKPDAIILREKDINVGFYETLARIGIGACRTVWDVPIAAFIAFFRLRSSSLLVLISPPSF